MTDALITEADGLERAVRAARMAGVVALDTEFVWEQTYYPRLGVIQLAWGAAGPRGEAEVVLLDAPALLGAEEGRALAPLGVLLADGGVVKVLHDAQQDLTILRRVSGGEPRNVFDTQRAAGFVGLPATLSLQDLARETVGIELQKGETRTDWLRRPLSAAQVAYAEDDVRYLPEVRRRLLDRAHVRDREAWIAEEMQRYDDPALYADAEPEAQHERVRAQGLGRLSPLQRSALRELAAWREEEARRADRPRRFVLPDEALVEIARRLPADTQTLERIGLSEKQARRYADGLLAAVRRAREAPPETHPRRPPPDPDEDRLAARTLLFQSLLAGRSWRQGMDAGLVATKADLRALVAAGPDAEPAEHPLLQGWRRAFIGYDLLALLDSRAGVILDPADGWPRFRPHDG